MVPFPPCGPPHLGCLLAWTFVLAPCFFSLSLSLGAFFYKVWQGFIILVASEAIKDIFIIKTLQNFPLCITVAFHYVFPPNCLWVKHGPIERTSRVTSENVIILVANEAIKDIFIIKTLQNFPLCITVAFHYVFPPNSLWVKHGKKLMLSMVKLELAIISVLYRRRI